MLQGHWYIAVSTHWSGTPIEIMFMRKHCCLYYQSCNLYLVSSWKLEIFGWVPWDKSINIELILDQVPLSLPLVQVVIRYFFL